MHKTANVSLMIVAFPDFRLLFDQNVQGFFRVIERPKEPYVCEDASSLNMYSTPQLKSSPTGECGVFIIKVFDMTDLKRV